MPLHIVDKKCLGVQSEGILERTVKNLNEHISYEYIVIKSIETAGMTSILPRLWSVLDEDQRDRGNTDFSLLANLHVHKYKVTKEHSCSYYYSL